MKIAILQSHFNKRGGLEKYTARLANAFAEKNLEVFLLTTETLTKETRSLPFFINPTVNVIFLTKSSSFTFYHLIKFDRACQKWLQLNKMDIVFGMDRNTFQTHYRAGNGVHASFLERRSEIESFWKELTFKINPLHLLLLKWERKAFEDSRLKVLFANSNLVKTEILTHYHVHPEKITVVHNGVEWNELEEPFNATFINRNEKLMAHGLNPKLYHFLFIGNGYERKGLIFLLKAMRGLQKNFQLSVIGKDKNISKFKKIAKEWGLEKTVHFFGVQKNPLPFYQMCDCLTIPSLYDPFANVTLEALSMGLFIVSSKTNGGHEILTEKTGAVIDDLLNTSSVENSLKIALAHRKTSSSACEIRNATKSLDFSYQLDKIIQKTINSQ